jgi:hypothetical protein
MREESYSFIWQPKVLMKTFLGEVMLRFAAHKQRNALARGRCG